MFMPQDYSWLEPVLVAAAIVFVVDLIGNMISFSNRFVNALVTATLFAIIFGAMSMFLLQKGMLPPVPTITVPATP